MTAIQEPKKRFYRQRAHANPFSDHALTYPLSPAHLDVATRYPGSRSTSQIKFADVGCGFGGLLFALAPLYPDTLILGMEIRVQVTQYVADKIRAKRALASTDSDSHHYNNISVVRANSMKFLPNFFRKGQLDKLFILFPDPHFKSRKHKARIVTCGTSALPELKLMSVDSATLAAEYAFALSRAGKLYIVTDVADLFRWMVEHLAGCPLFREATPEEQQADAVATIVSRSTEESRKAEREGRLSWSTVFIRL